MASASKVAVSSLALSIVASGCRLLACLILLAPLWADAGAVDDARARKLVAAHVDSKAHHAGVAAAILSSAGTRTYFYGTTGNASQPQVDEHTLFEIGSISKTVTAALLADMAGRGEVRFDTPLQELLPAEVRLESQRPRPITLEDLATHRSGLPRIPTSPLFDVRILFHLDNPYAGISEREFWGWFRGRRINSVGEHTHYSNLGFAVLGAVLSRRLGMSYEEAARTRVLEPLGMRETFVSIPAELSVRFAQPHNADGKAVPAWDMATFAAAGAFRSSLADMIVWTRANLERRAPLLPVLYEPRADDDEFPGVKVALAWAIWRKAGHTIVWHNGGTGGSASFVGFDTDSREGVVVLSNSEVETDELAQQLLGIR